MSVIKRDGTKVSFSLEKIRSALSKANSRALEMSDADINRIIEIVDNKCLKVTEDLTVETILDIVEDTLLKSRFNKTAKSYILYRDLRTRIRQGKSKLLKEVGEKLFGKNIVNQNANVEEASFGGRKGEASNALTKQYALDYCMSEKSRNNHLNNEIYIHDLSDWVLGTHNCLSIPFDRLLAEGFNTRLTDIRPANSISTAFQLLAVIFQLLSLLQFGGVAATHLDWTMVPYVRKSFFKYWRDGHKYLLKDTLADKLVFFKDMSIDDDYYKKFPEVYEYACDLTKKELQQSVEGMYHNLNTLQSRSGNQLNNTVAGC